MISGSDFNDAGRASEEAVGSYFERDCEVDVDSADVWPALGSALALFKKAA